MEMREDSRVLSLQFKSQRESLIQRANNLEGDMRIYLNSIHELGIDTIRLHLLTNNISDATQYRNHGGDFAVPSDKRRNTSPVNARGFSTPINI